MPERIERIQRMYPGNGHDWRPGTARPCYYCQKNRARPGQQGHCSDLCRFKSKVIFPASSDGCWLWGAAPNGPKKGYGRFSVARQRWLAHRYAHHIFNGPIPDGYEVDHKCRNQRCVNPAHLEALTPEEHDARTPFGEFQRNKTHCRKGHEYTPTTTRWSKDGRHRHCKRCDSPGTGQKGTRNAHAKLTEAIVIEARSWRAAGERVDHLAIRYGVSESVMSRALAGVTWSHVA